ncbi:GNAT family N-acetyltransferase [Natronomonas sp. LN261]|jgi:ribosomal protein S18 acetylase RimI-like enzyme|uniref:GNAT family N-acetyltransferase n=1 Tax=Natronomonas sp. LN261 TaxID=2750669 RepID=UPI0015EEA071|nr:GNAT family N-acetyltransferase [Natronomonas sp. LN261]
METSERPTFETEAGEEIYRYVERHGTAARHRVREVTSLPPEEFQDALGELKDRGYLEDDGGTLQIALDVGSVEAYSTDDVEYVIRPARQSDFEGLIDTIRDVTAEDTYIVAESIAEQLLYEDAVNRHNTAESRVFFVATVEGQVIGWSHLDLPQLDKLQSTAQLTVGVRGDYQQHGIGGRLVDRALEWAEANGYRKVYNSVPITNDEALAFLKSRGWETEGVRKDHYTIDDSYVDEVMLAYTF